MVVNFTALTESEIPILRQLAHEIWHAHYPALISRSQIDYMLGRMFSSEALRSDLENGVHWELAWHEGKPAGFLSVIAEDNAKAKLSKLYLIPELHGRGLGQEMLARVKARAEAIGTHHIHLTVNKKNSIAIRAYQKAGFKITGEKVADIGNGFVMDDYLMTWETP